MLPDQVFQIITVTADLLIFVFVGYYFLKFEVKERDLEKKEGKIDTEYHQIVDDALTKERKILEDATTEATQIIANTQYISQSSKETLDQSMQKMTVDIQKDAVETAQDFAKTYQTSLKQMATQSLNDFQSVIKSLETDLQKDITEFRAKMLPAMEKELEEYKQARLKETDKTVATVVQKVSQEVFNKSISLDDHQALLIDALEKAKKEGMLG